MDKTDRLRDYGLAFLLYEQGLGLCGYELIRELFIFVKLILNSYLRIVLEDKGISQTWLAKKLGRSFSTVNAYVCNRSQPNLTTLLEIAQLLSVDMKELITDEKERND